MESLGKIFNDLGLTLDGANNTIASGHYCSHNYHWLLQDEGFREMNDLVAFYRENAAILRKTFLDLGFSVYGGENAPYIWVGFPGKPSWDVFAEILEKCNIVTTPGSGFGPAGEGFVRASAFGHRYKSLLSPKLVKKPWLAISRQLMCPDMALGPIGCMHPEIPAQQSSHDLGMATLAGSMAKNCSPPIMQR